MEKSCSADVCKTNYDSEKKKEVEFKRPEDLRI